MPVIGRFHVAAGYGRLGLQTAVQGRLRTCRTKHRAVGRPVSHLQPVLHEFDHLMTLGLTDGPR